MSELEEKLENILGNPQAMAQIMSLAQSLNGGGSPPPAGTGEPSSAQEQASPAPARTFDLNIKRSAPAQRRRRHIADSPAPPPLLPL